MVKPQFNETKAHDKNKNSSKSVSETHPLVQQEEPIKQNEGTITENLELDSLVVPDSDEAEAMGVPEVKEYWPNQLWKAIRNAKDDSLTLKSTPLETVVEHS